MINENIEYCIDKEKLSLLKIKLILECGTVAHTLGFSTDPLSEIKSKYMKNFRTSYIMDENYKLRKEKGELLHRYEYDSFLISPLIREIDKLLKDDYSTVDRINPELFSDKEEKYFSEVLSCIKPAEKKIGAK